MVSDLGTAQPAYWVCAIRILHDSLHEFWRHACYHLGVLHGALQPALCIWFMFVLAAMHWHPMQQPASIVLAIPFKQTCHALQHASTAGAGKCVAIVVVTEKCV